LPRHKASRRGLRPRPEPVGRPAPGLDRRPGGSGECRHQPDLRRVAVITAVAGTLLTGAVAA